MRHAALLLLLLCVHSAPSAADQSDDTDHDQRGDTGAGNVERGAVERDRVRAGLLRAEVLPVVEEARRRVRTVKLVERPVQEGPDQVDIVRILRILCQGTSQTGQETS